MWFIYNYEVVVPHSFSHISPGSLPARPEKQPQNIQPFLRWCLSTIQVSSSSSSALEAAQVHACLPPVAQVSSDDRTFFKSPIDQLIYRSAKARRLSLVDSMIGGLRRAIYLLNPARRRAICIACLEQVQPSAAESRARLIRLLRNDPVKCENVYWLYPSCFESPLPGS